MVTLAVFRSWMPALNRVRAEVGLPPVRGLPGLMARADGVLVCSSPGYDFGSGSVPANVRYVGPQLDDDPGEGSGEWRAGEPGQPLVLVGLSSTVMLQEGLLQRAADALGQARVRGLVTTGPAVDPAVISAPPDVTVTRWVRHADVLPHCSAVITHGGHGTVMKALIAGVPLIVVPPRASPTPACTNSMAPGTCVTPSTPMPCCAGWSPNTPAPSSKPANADSPAS